MALQHIPLQPLAEPIAAQSAGLSDPAPTSADLLFTSRGPVKLTQSASTCLDGIRALAALAVMLGHWRGFFYIDYGNIKSKVFAPAVKILYAITGLGHQAVMVFFVLSGFLISSSIFRNLAQNTWSWREYAIDRSVRLYVVLLPGLVLGLFWDLSGYLNFNGSGIYSAPLIPFGSGIPSQALTPSGFIGNLLFLQTRFTPVFGSNGPLWSLFNEFWYYVLFPVLILGFICLKRRRIYAAIGFSMVAASTIWMLQSQVLGFFVWMAGAGVSLTSGYLRLQPPRRWPVLVYMLCTAAIWSICLFASRSAGNPLGSDLAVGVSFAFLVFGLLQLEFHIPLFLTNMARTFAGFSYSLYVLHFPLLLFIRAKWLPTTRWQPDAKHLSYGLCISAIVTLYAFGVARMTESKTQTIRAWTRRHLLHTAS